MKVSRFFVLSFILLVFLFCFIVTFLTFELSAFAECRPGTVPRNPAPVEPSEKPLSSGENCIVKVLDSFGLGEEFTKTFELTQGKSYWFAANGCPKMGTIAISVLDDKGKILKETKDYAPSLCFIAERNGQYTIKVKAISLTSGSSGNIDACFSESGCKK